MSYSTPALVLMAHDLPLRKLAAVLRVPRATFSRRLARGEVPVDDVVAVVRVLAGDQAAAEMADALAKVR